MVNRFQRYLAHQSQVMQMYVNQRQSQDSSLDPECLCSEWVQLFAKDYRNRFGWILNH